MGEERDSPITDQAKRQDWGLSRDKVCREWDKSREMSNNREKRILQLLGEFLANVAFLLSSKINSELAL